VITPQAWITETETELSDSEVLTLPGGFETATPKSLAWPRATRLSGQLPNQYNLKGAWDWPWPTSIWWFGDSEFCVCPGSDLHRCWLRRGNFEQKRTHSPHLCGYTYSCNPVQSIMEKREEEDRVYLRVRTSKPQLKCVVEAVVMRLKSFQPHFNRVATSEVNSRAPSTPPSQHAQHTYDKKTGRFADFGRTRWRHWKWSAVTGKCEVP